MRIAIVTETFNPEVNGVTRTLDHLVEGLLVRGHDLEVIRPRQRRDDHPGHNGFRELLVPGAPLPGYDKLRFGSPQLGRLRRSWREQRPDIVHIVTEGPLGMAAVVAASQLGIPLSSSFHTNFHLYSRHYGVGLLRGIGLRYLRWLHNRTGCTLVPTPTFAERLTDLGFHHVQAMGRGVDTEAFSPEHRRTELRRSWGAADEDVLVVAYVGRLATEKNLGLASRAFAAMRDERPDARFVLVGDGPHGEIVRKRHPDFVFAGMRLGSDLAAHFASADVLLNPSTTETFGNVVTEGMASGLAVLAYDYAAGRMHIRTDENGVTTPFGEAEAYVAAARQLAADGPDRWRRLGVAARKTALDITWDRVVDTFLNALEDVIERHGREDFTS
ncbi:MAG: glycosyltransferase family 1 protein [Acidobacteriota bacterium]